MAKANSPARKTTFSLLAPGAQTVQLAGSFSAWEQNAVALKKMKDGFWKTSVTLAPGEHEYLFLVDGQWMIDPDCLNRRPNPFGTENCVRHVE